MVLTFQLKGTDWVNSLKSNTQNYLIENEISSQFNTKASSMSNTYI